MEPADRPTSAGTWWEQIAASDSVPVIAGEGERVTLANDAFLELIGYRRKDLEHGDINWVELTPPEWRAVDEAALERMRRHGFSGAFRKEYRHRDGHRVPLVIGALLVDPEPFRWVSIVLDLTEELAAETELQRTSAKLESMVTESPVGLAFLDMHERFQEANASWAAIAGVPASAHIGRRPYEVGPEAMRLYGDAIAGVAAGGEPVVDCHVERSDEDEVLRHWLLSVFPVRSSMDELVGIGATAVEITGDVTARRRAERLLELAAQLAGTGTVSEVSEALSSFLCDTYDCRAAVALRDGDECRFEALCGFPEPFSEVWADSTLPIEDRSPLTDAVRTGAVIELTDPGPLPEPYRHLEPARRAAGDVSLLCWPIPDSAADEQVMGALHLSWPDRHVLSDHGRLLLRTVAAMASVAFNRVSLRERLERDRFRGALDALLDQVAIARSVRDEQGRIVDFEVEYANELSVDGAGRKGEQLVRGRVTELYPGWVESGLFDRFRRVVETGEPFVDPRMGYSDVTGDGPIEGVWSVSVSRFGDGYLCASRDVSAVVQAERIAAEHARVVERQRVAVDLLQRAALPTVLPRVDGLEVAALYRPAASAAPIGGDWYDVFVLDAATVGLVIADVAGHGAEAASLMVQVRNVVRALAFEYGTAHEVMQRVNNVVTSLNSDEQFVTCCYALLNLENTSLSWSRAGHFDPVLLAPDGAATYPDTRGGPPLGIYLDARYPTQTTVELQPGHRVVMFTDGLIERPGESIDDGLHRLTQRLQRRPFDELTPWVEELGDHGNQFDDLAILGAELEDVVRTPSGPRADGLR